MLFAGVTQLYKGFCLSNAILVTAIFCYRYTTIINSAN